MTLIFICGMRYSLRANPEYFTNTHTRADSHAHSPLAQLFRFIPVALRYGGKKFVQLSA